MAMFTSYDAVGIKEDVSDIITNISPTKTPFQSAIGREKITQKVFQWQEDSLRAAGSNAQTEGFDVSSATSALLVGDASATTMLFNNTQIFAEVVNVSGTMEATSTYGRARESAYQMAKAAAQVKRDLEVALVGGSHAGSLTPAAANVAGASSGITSAQNTSGTARVMSSYDKLLTAAGNFTYSIGGTDTNGAIGYTLPEAAGTAALSEGALLQALENCYNNGAEPDCIYVTPANAWTLSNFAKAAGRYRQIQDNGGGNAKQVVNAVDLYVSPYGEIKIYINRWLNGAPLAASAQGATANPWTLVVDPSMWSLATLRPWFREVLAKTGDSIKQMIVGEFSLKCKNQLASSMVIDNAITSV